MARNVMKQTIHKWGVNILSIHEGNRLALGGTIWRLNQWLNFARKWFNSIFDSKENCQDSIQIILDQFNSIEYSIQNNFWPIQFNKIVNSSLEFQEVLHEKQVPISWSLILVTMIQWYSPSSWKYAHTMCHITHWQWHALSGSEQKQNRRLGG